MSFFFIFILITIAMVLFAFGFRWIMQFSEKNKENIPQKKIKRKSPPHSNCPLCNSALYPGENLVSRVYKGSTPKDQACTIHGCPYCYPTLKLGIQRTCPVCHKSVPTKGHLDAHLFLRDTGKKNVQKLVSQTAIKKII